jgi:inosine-uridine nucleoside N-ribohydrolase
MRARVLTFVLVLCAVLAAAGSRAAPALRAALPTAPTPLVVDTDMSTDDVLALLYLLRRADVDLRAVTVSGTGLTRCPPGARNALDLLALGRRSDVLVACGLGEPLAGFDQFPSEWRGAADALFGLPLPPSARGPDPRGAVELLRATLEASPDPVTVLALGPLTDVAALLRAHPSVAPRIARVVAMGGAVHVPGNVGAGHENVEFNLWIDPVAADEVLASGVPVTLVPLDATNDVPATVSVALALERYHYATPEAAAAWEIMAGTGLFLGGEYFWDPLAATAVTRPSTLRFADERLRVVTASGPDHGRVVAAATGAPVRVAVGADRGAFEAEFLATLAGAPVPIPEVRAATITYDGRTCSYTGPRRGEAGQVVVETVNTGDRAFTVVPGTLRERRTAAALAKAVVRDGGLVKPKTWFSPEPLSRLHEATTPPHSRMTWLGAMTPGRKAIVCAVRRPAQAWVATVTLTTPQ